MKTRRIIALLIAAAMTLGGCSVQKNAEENYPDSDASANPKNIMETENGFYIGGASSLFLMYHDKQTGNEIMLCDKPECPHDGRETCTATYNYVHPSNVVFYNNSLYFTAAEGDGENLTVSLYKVKNDGSALDKVCTLYSVKSDMSTYQAGSNECNMIIHRGYVFVSVSVGNGMSSNYADFLGGGLYRINLRNNEITQLIAYNDYFGEKVRKIIPSGDYVFFEASDSSRNLKTYRMKADSDTPEEVLKMEIVSADSSAVYTYDFSDFNEDTEKYKVVVYNPETLEKTNEFGVDNYYSVLYDGKFISYNENTEEISGITIPIYENGKKIAEVNNIPGNNETRMYVSFSCGKMYIIRHNSDFYIGEEKFTYYSCPFEDVLSGNPQWNQEYDTKEMNSMWRKHVDDALSKGTILWTHGFFL